MESMTILTPFLFLISFMFLGNFCGAEGFRLGRFCGPHDLRKGERF